MTDAMWRRKLSCGLEINVRLHSTHQPKYLHKNTVQFIMMSGLVLLHVTSIHRRKIKELMAWDWGDAQCWNGMACVYHVVSCELVWVNRCKFDVRGVCVQRGGLQQMKSAHFTPLAAGAALPKMCKNTPSQTHSCHLNFVNYRASTSAEPRTLFAFDLTDLQ